MPPGVEECGLAEEGPWRPILDALPFISLVTRPDDRRIVYVSPAMAGIIGGRYCDFVGSDASCFFQYVVLPGGGLGVPGGAPDGTICRFLSGGERFCSWKSQRFVSQGAEYILDTFEEQGLLAWKGSFDPSFQGRHRISIILKWTHGFRITYIERSGADYLGYAPEELLGKPLVGTLVPEHESSAQKFLHLVEKVSKGSEDGSPCETEVIKKDGTRVRILWFSSGLRGSDGEIAEYLSVGAVITDQGCSLSVFNSRHAVISISMEGKVSGWDDVAAKAFGYSEMEALGADFIDLIVPEAGRAFHRRLVKAVQDSQSRIGGFISGHGYRQGICLKKDGTRFPVELSVIPGPGVPASPFSEGAVVVMRGLTEEWEAGCREIRYARNIALLSGTAMAFVEMDSGPEIYDFIGRQIRSLAGNSIVTVNSYDPKDRSFCTQAVFAEEEERASYVAAVGSDVVGSRFPITDQEEVLFTAERGISRASGLYKVLTRTVPRETCTFLESELGIMAIYVVPFVRRDRVFGCAIILVKESARLENVDIIEAFMNQTAVALQRHCVGEALRESEETARALLDATPDLAFLNDHGGRILSYNEPARVALGGDTILACQKVETIVGAEFAYHLHEALGSARVSGKPVQFETEWGEQIIFVRVSPVAGPDCEVTRFAVFIRDVTDARRAEEALMIANRHLNDTIEHLPDAILVVDRQGRVVSWNRAMEELTGVRRDEILGEGDHAYAIPFYERRRPMLIDLVEAGDDEVQALYPNVRRMDGLILSSIISGLRPRDGRSLHLSATASPITDLEGTVVGGIESIRDVTLEKTREEEYLRNEKLESIGLLAGGIAHDFNNILTSVLGNITLSRMKIREGCSPDDNLMEAEKALKKARFITQRLLTFSRGGAPVLETVELSDFSTLVLETADFVCRGMKSSFKATFDPGLWQVNIDPAQFSQVIQNLMINADQAMPCGGTVRIDVRNRVFNEDRSVPAGRYVALSVADTGVGILPDHLPRIFDPYFTTWGEGRGLGLATVRSIVKNHGGYVTAVSDQDGSVFTVSLPAASNGKGGVGGIGHGETAGRSPEHDAHILFMDDDEGVLSSIVPILESEGYCVTAVSDGSEAVKRYTAARESGRPFDLVIMDLTVPGGMGGVETIEILKKTDPSVKAIVSSGYSTDPVMSVYQEYGFIGVVRKPYPIEELFAEVRRVLSM